MEKLSDNLQNINPENANYKENKDFTTLETWRKARLVKLFFIKEIVPKISEEEKFNLTHQIRKCCTSITANIAEGYGRYSFQEGIQFFRISRGSIYEIKDHLITCYDYNYINKDLLNKGIQLIEELKIILNSYINYLKKLKNEKKH